ncbi:MAG: hypothetical protein ABI860_06080 [Gemmatimonadales bacterium]
MRAATAAVCGAAWLAAACHGDAAKAPSGARLAVRWTGSDTSSFDAPATAERCDSSTMLQIVAIAGDTGIGIALYPSDSNLAAVYTVRPPSLADSAPPAGAVGLRWFSQTSVQGYQADSGQVSVTRAPNGALSGRFKATARAITGTGRLTLAGSFDDLRARRAARGCGTGPAPLPAAPDDSEESDEGVD